MEKAIAKIKKRYEKMKDRYEKKIEAADDADEMKMKDRYEKRLENLKVEMNARIAKAEKASSLSLAVVLNRLHKKKEKKTRYP